jgi:hypothetical protein
MWSDLESGRRYVVWLVSGRIYRNLIFREFMQEGTAAGFTDTARVLIFSRDVVDRIVTSRLEWRVSGPRVIYRRPILQEVTECPSMILSVGAASAPSIFSVWGSAIKRCFAKSAKHL